MLNKFRTNSKIIKSYLIVFILIFSIFTSQATINANSRISKDKVTNLIEFNLSRIDSKVYPEQYVVNESFTYYVSPYDRNIYRLQEGHKNKVRLTVDEVGESGIVLNNGYIYYENSLDKGNLYRIDINGKNRQRVSRNSKYFRYDNFFKLGDSIYYYSKDGSIYSVKDNILQIKMSKESSSILSRMGRFSTIYNGCIYSYDPTKFKGIYRTDIKSGKVIKICKDNIYSDIKIFNNNIYYVNYNDSSLYRISLDGKIKKKLLDTQILNKQGEYDMVSFDIIRNRIYFVDRSKNNYGSLDSVNLDGRERRSVLKGIVDFKYYNNRIYYIKDMGSGLLCSSNLWGKNIKIFQRDYFINILSINSNKIVCYVKSNNVMEPEDGRIFVRPINRNIYTELK